MGLISPLPDLKFRTFSGTGILCEKRYPEAYPYPIASTNSAGEEFTNWNISENIASRRVGVNAFVTRRRRRLERLRVRPRGTLRSLNGQIKVYGGWEPLCWKEILFHVGFHGLRCNFVDAT